MGYLNLVQTVARNAVSEGTHMKVFKDGSVGRLVDYVENGVRKSRLTITHNNGYPPTERLTTRIATPGHKSITQHTMNDGFLGEAYTEGHYKTKDRYYNNDHTLKLNIVGTTTPKYEKQYGNSYSYSLSGARDKNIPWYNQFSQYIQFLNNKIHSFEQGPSGMHNSEIPVTEEIEKEYAFLQDLAKRPLNLLG